MEHDRPQLDAFSGQAGVDEVDVSNEAEVSNEAGVSNVAGVWDGAQVDDGVDVEIDESLLDAIEQDLADVERALAMIDDGTYGRCDVCGNTIDDEHLSQAPASRFCRDHLPLPLP